MFARRNSVFGLTRINDVLQCLPYRVFMFESRASLLCADLHIRRAEIVCSDVTYQQSKHFETMKSQLRVFHNFVILKQIHFV